MTDLEITLLCAEAMGFEIVSSDPNWVEGLVRTDVAHEDGTIMVRSSRVHPYAYKPLHNDAQAMALVKKFDLSIYRAHDEEGRPWSAMWAEQYEDGGSAAGAESDDLNRAICECVAKMQVAK